MAVSHKMVSGKQGEKLVFFPTQLYNAPSGKVDKRFVANISVEIDGIRAWKWNSNRVIVFQSVILQHDQAVSNSKYICARIQF